MKFILCLMLASTAHASQVYHQISAGQVMVMNEIVALEKCVTDGGVYLKGETIPVGAVISSGAVTAKEDAIMFGRQDPQVLLSGQHMAIGENVVGLTWGCACRCGSQLPEHWVCLGNANGNCASYNGKGPCLAGSEKHPNGPNDTGLNNCIKAYCE